MYKILQYNSRKLRANIYWITYSQKGIGNIQNFNFEIKKQENREYFILDTKKNHFQITLKRKEN